MSRRFLTLVLLALAVLSGCKLADKESERTRAQLGRLAKDTGTEAIAEQMKKGYDENIGPVVSNADNFLDQYQNYERAKELGSQAGEKLAELGSSAHHSIDRLTRSMPQSEQEITAAIDEYNREFVAWLKENWPEHAMRSARDQGTRLSSPSLSSKRRSIHGRPAPH